ncbi:MAG: tRNA (5-methylaminomethyl-2-thiouridine)(34)-methyltransferase MnmD [Pseudomonadota bacterium]
MANNTIDKSKLDLDWRDGDIPVSTRFDDVYFSKEDGRAETDYVFIEGNHLPSRWPGLETCVIAELGFGTGLNFLETTRQWLQQAKQNQRLHFYSFEQYPIRTIDLERSLNTWPELEPFAKLLIEAWNPSLDVLEINFGHNIELKVFQSDANLSLKDTKFTAHAWYLDGFSPAKNPELWNQELIQSVADHTVAEGTFATYTAAGFVRRNLQNAGFDVQKTQGFGRKRNMLIGTKSATSMS